MTQVESVSTAETDGMTGATSISSSPASSVVRQGSRFTLVGSAGTGLQLGLYALLATVVGPQVASATSWLVSTVLTNRVHRALTFQVHSAERSRTDSTAAFLTSLVGLGVTAIVLARLTDADGFAGLVAIVAVNITVGAGRFFGLRWWLGGSGRSVLDSVAVTVHTARTHFQTRHMSLHH